MTNTPMEYQVINGEIYQKSDPIDPDSLKSNREMLVAATQKAQSDIVNFQSQIDSIDAVLAQLPA